jgi:hypothetical protein
MLGACGECGKALVYNVHDLPFCIRCDGLRISDFCPWCGCKTKDGVIEEDHVWFCVECGRSRDFEFSHYDMGSGSAKSGMPKLFWSAYRYMRRELRDATKWKWLVLLVIIEILRLRVEMQHLAFGREVLDKIEYIAHG